MDVYVLIRTFEWEGDVILGVFSSRDSAISAFKQYRQEIHGDAGDNSRFVAAIINFDSHDSIHYGGSEHYYIQKFTVDQLDH